ncbi:MGH1-like glycoside hydrolase domain-containing protein [Paenibacillus sp. FSL K6-0108]|uniref:MGH1-like glycoside hydrolase domain-containing protein n=1 Tax=Paenibacillus sp. FSL K6-0108 TaxID=2921417 RepID=UPI00325197FC
MTEALLNKLRQISIHDHVQPAKPEDQKLIQEWQASGVRFAASGGRLEATYYSALEKLLTCIVPLNGSEPILQEGGIYLGCWLESTGTINAELLSRLIPSVSETTYLAFARHQREDGLLPYKLTENGPSFRQIQLVTPLARSVWNHYQLHGKNLSFLKTMYKAMVHYDEWIATYRNTRGTGCVEAFSTFDTGHDLSPRFWHVPDTPYMNDAASYHPDSPVLPFLAPDLTANMYCQRMYLSRMAEELGESGGDWKAKAETSLESLFRYCYDEEDMFFYDRDRNDEWVRVQSDVLLRVMACEVGDREMFDHMLRRYLLNTSKFFAKYPFTSMSMDDPRFDPFSSYNSWGGASNFLSLIRAPHAFEYHHRYVELTWVLQPILSSLSKAKRFAQAVSPWTGEEGFTETYSPSILCLLDYVERLCGIMPVGSDQLWFTGLLPIDMDHGEEVAGHTAYSRTMNGLHFELVNTPERVTVYQDGKALMGGPAGIRFITDRSGHLEGVIGMSVRTIEGELIYRGNSIPIRIKGNELQRYAEGSLKTERDIGIIYPSYC